MGNRFSYTHLFSIKISPRKFFAVTILISGTLAWFFLIQMYFFEIFSRYSVDVSWTYFGLFLFYGVGVLSAIIGSSVSEKVNRRKLVFLWIVFGVVVTVSLTMFQGEVFTLIFGVLLGISFGFGFPSCAALLADFTVPEERAKVSGVVILTTFILIALLGMIIIPLLNIGLIGAILVFAALRTFSMIGLALDKCDRKSGKTGSWFSVLKYRGFASYVVPWVLFNATVGLLSWWDIPQTSEFVYVTTIGVSLAYVSIAFSGLIAGVVADRFGRRQPIMISFVMLGVSFVLLTFYLTPLILLIYYITYGVAWGFLFTLYLAVPGDLSYSGSKEKFYALGAMMPLIVYMSLSTASAFINFSVSATFLSGISTIILFLSIIPVHRATETLPEKTIREGKLKEHIRKVAKLKKELEQTK